MSSPPALDAQSLPLDSLLLNKIDTEQDAFLSRNSSYDGRGILIAVIDTGVDPSLPGMQLTSDGRRKMVDCIDCSGAGDVDTSTVRTVADGKIEGLTGRILQIPEEWVNPTGKYHVGVKPIYELYTKYVRDTISKDKKDNDFKPSHNHAAADALRLLTAHETEIGGTSDKQSDKWEREEHACKVDFLKSVQSLTEPGPIADVVAWHDGEAWKACIDTSFRGRLGMCTPMGSFKETGQYGVITQKDSVVYTLRIAPNGNLVEICVPSGAHGSHVANIAAANYPENPQKNGLAPGAQVISLNIGDMRLSAMETGQAMTRAFNLCAERNVDVINMSFGEGVHMADVGRVIEEARQLIFRRGVIFVCSAGNSGPALSTVGAPGGTTTGVIGIGAYLTAESADTLYGVYNPVESNIYPWSSRGPCADGKLGVSLCAPAAAFAGVPKYMRQSMQMMNGTSMSSPNAAGSIACMLSALRAENLEWTPYTVRLALENTAQPLHNSDRFSMGQGMIKISSAYDRLVSIIKDNVFPPRLTHFEVKCSYLNRISRGIYIREPRFDQPQEFSVIVQPKFKDQSPDNDEVIAFERQCVLQCDAEWVDHPKTLFIIAQDRSLVVTIDASKAPKGANYTEIVGIDTAAPSLGPIFRIPITVIVPDQVADLNRGYSSKLVGMSGAPERRFVAVPSCATSAEIVLKTPNKQPLDRFTLHTVYVQDEHSPRNTEACKLFGPTGDEWTKTIPVRGGKTLEVCVVRNWSRGKQPVDVELQVLFHGVKKPDLLSLVHGSTGTPFRIQASPIRSFEISPSISLKTLVIPHKPTSAKIEPLGPRDVFLVSALQINRLLLSYKINVTKQTELRLELPGLTSYLYESPIDCVLLQVFGAGKAFISAAGPYPDRYTNKLEKGEYVVQAQIRHPDESVLDKFRDTPLLVHTKLGSAITVDVATTASGACFGGDTKWSNKGLMPNQEITCYATSIAEDKIPKNITPTSGSFLLGDLTVFKDSEKKVDKSPVQYWLAEWSTRPSKALSMVTQKKEQDQNQEMNNAIRDLQISWLTKLKDETAANELYATCSEKYPDHLPLITARVKQLMSKPFLEQTAATIRESMTLSNKLLELCNPAEVLQYLGMKVDSADDLLTADKWMAYGSEEDAKAAAKAVQGIDERKNAIVVALQALCSIELDRALRASPKQMPLSVRYGALSSLVFGGKSDVVLKKKDLAALEAKGAELDVAVDDVIATTAEEKKLSNYVKLLAWLPADDAKMQLISARHAATMGHWGRCAKMLNKASEEARGSGNDTKVVDATLAEVCDELGWVHLANNFRNVSLIKNRNLYRLF